MFNPNLDGAKVRKLYKLNGNPVLLFIGALNKLKGVELLIEAIKLVAKELPNVKLLIVGQGPLKDKLMKCIKDCSLEDNVLLIGPRPHSVIPLYLAASDVLVHPSLAESLGRVLLEAQAVAKPVVAFKIGGIREAVRNGVTGILVKPYDVAEFAKAIITLLKNPELARRMGFEGRNYVEKSFEFWSQEKKLVKLYSLAIKRKL